MKNSLFLFIIGLFFGGGIGFLTASATGAQLEPAHDHSAHGAPHDDSGALHGTMAGHDHDSLLENGAPVSVTFAATAEGAGGVNLQIRPEGFTFAPEAVNAAHVTGQGHAHVYVDGVKIVRAYGPWVHLPGLAPGEAEIRVTLNANSHQQLATEGQPVEARQIVTID
ncbi:hypothetical protein [Pseudooceanicola aestuarii]|uniref:hypothetical protein n=1 Tax=Pseudooceanicola aestuarii TaxID=2697319 RepID=UPI0013CFEE1F|nr:hypothetical protein [Pseudooceanicola aestuarii]